MNTGSKINSHCEGICPKNRKGCRLIPLSCFSGEEQFQHELASVRNCGEVKTAVPQTNLSAILKLTPFAKNSSSPADAGEGNMRTLWAAFTLAEVLITLTIIGVIAAITIPNLMKKWEDHHTVVAVKEAYSIIDNAIKSMVRDNDIIEDWAFGDESKSVYFAEHLLPYFKNATYCAPGSYGKDVPCIASFDTLSKYWGDRKQLNGTMLTSSAKGAPSIRLANGMLIMNIQIINIPAAADGTIGQLIIDINGKNGPNRLGYDTFYFGFGNNGLILKSEHANTGTAAYRRDECQDPTSSGRSCGRYIMFKGDVDYKYKSVTYKWPIVGWW